MAPAVPGPSIPPSAQPFFLKETLHTLQKVTFQVFVVKKFQQGGSDHSLGKDIASSRSAGHLDIRVPRADAGPSPHTDTKLTWQWILHLDVRAGTVTLAGRHENRPPGNSELLPQRLEGKQGASAVVVGGGRCSLSDGSGPHGLSLAAPGWGEAAGAQRTEAGGYWPSAGQLLQQLRNVSTQTLGQELPHVHHLLTGPPECDMSAGHRIARP